MVEEKNEVDATLCVIITCKSKAPVFHKQWQNSWHDTAALEVEIYNVDSTCEFVSEKPFCFPHDYKNLRFRLG